MNNLLNWIDLSNLRCFTNLGKESTVFRNIISGQSVSSYINFEPNRIRPDIPEFAGLYLLCDESIKVNSGGYLSFNISSPNSSIFKIYVEIKPVDRKVMHEVFEIPVTSTNEPTKIYFANFKNHKIIDYINEFTFVVKPDCFTNIENLEGEVIISNIMIEGTEIEKGLSDVSLDHVSEQILEIQNDVKKILSVTEKIAEFMQNDLHQILKEQKEVLNKNISDLSDDTVISQVFNNCSNLINDKINEIGDSAVDNERNYLRKLFGGVWDKLLPSTKLSLISSKSMWEACKNIGQEFDYSGIVICATAALENELKRVFGISFNNFLNIFDTNPKGRFSYNYKGFTLGSLIHFYKGEYPFIDILPMLNIYVSKKTKDKDIKEYRHLLSYRLWNGYFDLIKKNCYNSAQILEYYKLKSKISELTDNSLQVYLDGFKSISPNKRYINFLREQGADFVKHIDLIATSYRNEAAHANYVNHDTAEKCYNAIIGDYREIISKANATTIMELTPTAIIELYELIDINKLFEGKNLL